MKKLLVAIAAGIALTSPVQQAASKDTGAPQSSSKTPPAGASEFDRNLGLLREQMKTMQAQMDQIGKTQEPQERQKLLEQHWATMQSAMTIMHGMWGPGMMGHGMGPGMMGGAGPGMMGGWGHMGGYYSHLTPEQLRQRQYMTDQYLQMQQEMMNNMMWQQQYRMGPPAGKQ
jgi:hypothetical protein